MAQSVITVRVEENVKNRFSELCTDLGMNANVAVNMFIHQMVKERGMPFVVSANRSSVNRSYAEQQWERTWRTIRRRAEQSTEPELSLEEINAEIAAARSERKMRKTL